MTKLKITSALRFSLAYAGLFGLSALLLLTFLWWAVLGLLNGEVDAAIRADALNLAGRLRDGGVPALVNTIGIRLAGNVDEGAVYVLRDAEGHVLVGNLFVWPEGRGPGKVFERVVDRGGRQALARMQVFALPGDCQLLIGRDVAARAALRGLLARTLLAALLGIAVVALAGGALVQRMFIRMLASVSATSAAIAAGDLTTRVRLSGRGDEFDRLAATLNDMLNRTERLMDGVRQVSNAIAHDLRTPITRARARLEDALEHRDNLVGAAERAVADLDGITSVFQALLRIAEIEAGARRSAFCVLDAKPLLAGVIELYQPVAEERDLTLRFEMPGALRLQGDRELIQQAVANLLDNAIKFSPPGGVVRVVAGPGARIAVIDQGPGIPAGDRLRATERFFRGDAARHAPGYGLGLTLVQAVATLHGGALSLESAGPGLRAVLTLPEGLAAEGEDQHVAVRRLAGV